MKLSTVLSTLLLIPLLQSANVFAAADNPIKGEELFKQCVACHQLGADAQNTVGPALNHVFGRQAGSVEDFNYSDPMRAKGSEDKLVWDEESMYLFLAGPAAYVPGTIMGFAGLATEQEIRDLMAYLIQFSPAYEKGSGQLVSAEAANAATLPEIKADDGTPEDPAFTDEFMASADAIADGGVLWVKQCRHCHGNSAYPGKAPKLKPASYSADFVFDRLTNGFRKMPAWKTVYSLEQRKNIVAYIMSRKFSP